MNTSVLRPATWWEKVERKIFSCSLLLFVARLRILCIRCCGADWRTKPLRNWMRNEWNEEIFDIADSNLTPTTFSLFCCLVLRPMSAIVNQVGRMGAREHSRVAISEGCRKINRLRSVCLPNAQRCDHATSTTNVLCTRYKLQKNSRDAVHSQRWGTVLATSSTRVTCNFNSCRLSLPLPVPVHEEPTRMWTMYMQYEI